MMRGSGEEKKECVEWRRKGRRWRNIRKMNGKTLADKNSGRSQRNL